MPMLVDYTTIFDIAWAFLDTEMFKSMRDVIYAVKDLGFPIVMCLILLWFLYWISDKYNKKQDSQLKDKDEMIKFYREELEEERRENEALIEMINVHLKNDIECSHNDLEKYITREKTIRQVPKSTKKVKKK